jgi:hypothetical protein
MTPAQPALDALEKRLLRADEYEPLGHDGWEAAAAIRALRAAPVAMRRAASNLACDLAIEAAEKAEAENLTPYQIGLFFGTETAARGLAEAIEALPLDAPVDYNPSLRGQWNFPDLFVEPAGFGRPAFTDEEAPPADPYLDAPAPVDPVAEAARDNGFFALIVDGMAEADRAMRKFPQPNYVISKFAEEAGEVVKAAIHCAEGRETADNVRGEMRQVIAMMYRLWVEGDQVHGLLAIAQETPHD